MLLTKTAISFVQKHTDLFKQDKVHQQQEKTDTSMSVCRKKRAFTLVSKKKELTTAAPKKRCYGNKRVKVNRIANDTF